LIGVAFGMIVVRGRRTGNLPSHTPSDQSRSGRSSK
jgi:hypothetical protein